MSIRRSISWNSALAGLRADRVAPAAAAAYRAAQHASKVEAIRAKAGAALVSGGTFDRAAIMALAIRSARCARANKPGLTWSAAMADALRYAWSCAHAARRAAAH